MESFLSRYKNGLVLLVVLLGQLIALALQVRRPLPDAPDAPPVRLLRYWMVSLITPPARVSHGAGRGVRGIWSNYIALRDVRQQNLDLQAEIERLRLEEGAIAEDARQGQRLQALEGFKEHYVYSTTTAQVIGTAGTDRSRLIIIDKGARNGVSIDMPVITPDGIVGKVREAFPHTAQVLEISDPSSGAGVMLQTTRIRGVLRGNAFGEPEIINIMPDDRIKPGEPVVTSGGDQIYPRGLPVGVVDRIANDPDRAPYVDVIIKPGANLARLEEVLVVTGLGDQLPPSDQGELAQSEAEAQRHSAAEVLSEKLPGIRDPNAPAAAGPGIDSPDGKPADAAGATPSPDAKPTLPPKPPPPLHSDRFTPGSSPSAMYSLPGQAAPVPPRTAPTHAPSTPRQSAPAQTEPQTTGQDFGAIPDTPAENADLQPGTTATPAAPKRKPPTASSTPKITTAVKPAHTPQATTASGAAAPAHSAAPKPATNPPVYVEPYFVKQPHSTTTNASKTQQPRSTPRPGATPQNRPKPANPPAGPPASTQPPPPRQQAPPPQGAN